MLKRVLTAALVLGLSACGGDGDNPTGASGSGTLEITDVGFGGKAVARLEDGRVCFVRDALPGERVKVRLRRETARFVEADLVEVAARAEVHAHRHDVDVECLQHRLRQVRRRVRDYRDAAPSRVVRHFQEGVAIEFANVLSKEGLQLLM